MKNHGNTRIIGIDHGYGNIKTANCCFPTGVTAYTLDGHLVARAEAEEDPGVLSLR